MSIPWKRISLVSLGLLLFLLSVTLSYALFNYKKILVASAITPGTIDSNHSPAPSATPDPLAPYNVLLLGYGGAGHSGGEITDTMIVGHVEPREKTLTLISIPRDLWVPLPLSDTNILYRKINHAYALGNDPAYDKVERYTGEAGGANLARDVVNQVTNLPIRYFVSVNFQAFQASIDALDGITVDVPVSFVDEYYPIKGEEDNPCGKSGEEIEALTATISGYKLEQEFKCRYERLAFAAGPVHMDGETALKYVRSRHSDTYGNDFSRAERQQTVIKALQQEVLSLGSLPKLLPLINTITNFVRTDVSLNDIRRIWATHDDLSQFTIQTLILSTDNVLTESRSQDRQYILIPQSGEEDWQSIHEFISTQLASPSATLAD